MSSPQRIVEVIRKLVREAREERNVPPSRFKGHIFDTELFRKIFGVSYRDIIHAISGPSLFVEISSIVSSVKTGGLVLPLLVDRDYVIVDGGTRALALSFAGIPADRVLVLPIRCLESEQNLIICTVVALWTLKGKGKSEEVYKVFELLKPGLLKYGVEPSLILGVDVDELKSALEVAAKARPAPSTTAAPETAKLEEDILTAATEAIAALNLPNEVLDGVRSLMKFIPPARILEKLAAKRGWQKISMQLYLKAVAAIARAYVFKVGHMIGVPERELRKLKSEKIGDVMTRDLLNDAIYILAGEWKLIVSPDTEVELCMSSAIQKLSDFLKDVDAAKLLEEAKSVYAELRDAIRRAVQSNYERAILALYAAARKLKLSVPSLRTVFSRLGKTGPAVSYILKRIRQLAEKDEKARKLLELLS